MTVQNGQCRDGGWEDVAGQPPDFRYSGHHQKRGPGKPLTRRDSHWTSVILDITKREVQGNPGRGGTVKWMAAGRCHGGVA